MSKMNETAQELRGLAACEKATADFLKSVADKPGQKNTVWADMARVRFDRVAGYLKRAEAAELSGTGVKADLRKAISGATEAQLKEILAKLQGTNVPAVIKK